MYTETQTFLTFILRSSLDLETRLGDGVEVAETLLTSSTSGDPIGIEDDPGLEAVLEKKLSSPSFMSCCPASASPS